MAFFNNPFAPSGGPPILPSTTINPTSTSFPLETSVRRSSLARASNSGTGDISVPLSPASTTSGGSGGGSASPGSSGTASGSLGGGGGITFISPFASTQKRPSIAPSTFTVVPGRRPSTPGSPAAAHRSSSARSSSQPRSASGSESPKMSASRRESLQGTPSPLRSPAAGAAHAPPFFSGFTASATSSNGLLRVAPEFPRRRSVDVGVLGVGTRRVHGMTAMSRRMRDAVGPDAGDKATGVVGAGAKGAKDRLLGRHLASLLAHSLSLCAEPKNGEAVPVPPPEALADVIPHPILEAIPASPISSPTPSRNTSVSAESVTYNNAGTIPPGFPHDAPTSSASNEPSQRFGSRPPSAPTSAFPTLSEAKRFKLIANLQSWSFNAMSYSSDELLACVGIIFESVRNMEGVDFDLERFKSLLLSIRCAYHSRNGYHNFNHAADVTQACYSFLVRMGLAPPLYLLCEDDYDANLGEGRRKWRRNRAVEEGGMGELLRPMDIFALMVACIGHDVGHPGLTNAYMVNACAPVAQIYNDKSILENFHTVTLIHMLRRHNFEYLLGGDFGHLGERATPFRKILEASILATDMSRHFAFVTELTEMGKRLSANGRRASGDLEADKLLLCAGLIKCADISNPTRPHRISRVWAQALQEEWGVQASIEANFGLPITVMTQDPGDVKAQAKGQVGFIDLFCKPLFGAMSTVVDEFADFVEKLRDGRAAWEAISLLTDEAFAQPIARDFTLPAAPPLRREKTSESSGSAAASASGSVPPSPRSATPASQASDPTSTPLVNASPALGEPATASKPVPMSIDTRRIGRPTPLRTAIQRPLHVRQSSSASSTSLTTSPLSPLFANSAGSPSSAATAFSSFSQLSAISVANGLQTADSVSLYASPKAGGYDPSSPGILSSSVEKAQRSVCGGACLVGTAMCEVCAAAQRRGSLGNALEERDRMEEEDDDEELDLLEGEEDSDVWPPHPFQPTRHAIQAAQLAAA